jgi:hypothetical protein
MALPFLLVDAKIMDIGQFNLNVRDKSGLFIQIARIATIERLRSDWSVAAVIQCPRFSEVSKQSSSHLAPDKI